MKLKSIKNPTLGMSLGLLFGLVAASCSNEDASFVASKGEQNITLEVDKEQPTSADSAKGKTGDPADSPITDAGSTDTSTNMDPDSPNSSADSTDSAGSEPTPEEGAATSSKTQEEEDATSSGDDVDEVTSENDDDSNDSGSVDGEEIVANGKRKGKGKRNNKSYDAKSQESENNEEESDEEENEGESAENESEDSEEPSNKDIADCGKKSGDSSKRVHIVGSKEIETIEFDSVVAIKMSGKKSALTMTLKGEEGAKVKGICIFASGNQPVANINIVDVELGSITFIGRGNQSKINISVSEGGKLSGITADLKGNKSTVNVSGAGEFDCGSAEISSKKGTFNCAIDPAEAEKPTIAEPTAGEIADETAAN